MSTTGHVLCLCGFSNFVPNTIFVSAPQDTPRQNPGLASPPQRAHHQLRPQQRRRRRLPRAGTNQRIYRVVHLVEDSILWTYINDMEFIVQ